MKDFPRTMKTGKLAGQTFSDRKAYYRALGTYSRMGYIYIIRFDRHIKVGVTTSPRKRLRGLPHHEVLSVSFHEGASVVEHELHDRLWNFRASFAETCAAVEWYRDSPQLRSALERWARDCPDNIELRATREHFTQGWAG